LLNTDILKGSNFFGKAGQYYGHGYYGEQIAHKSCLLAFVSGCAVHTRPTPAAAGKVSAIVDHILRVF
jgi:hypothetical protein